MGDAEASTSGAEMFLMSYPRPDWGVRGGANFVSSRSDEAGRWVSPNQAMRDWLSIAHAIEDAGGSVIVLPPAPHLNMTGLPYTAEAGMFFVKGPERRPAFVLPRMVPEHRRAEATYTAGFVAALGWEALPVPVPWEAQGDAIRVDAERVIHTWGVGRMARTSQHAYQHVAPLLSPKHLQLRFHADPWFHGNTFLAVFRDARTQAPVIMVCLEALADGEFERLQAFAGDTPIVEIDREESLAYGTNALQVGSTVIAPSGLPSTLHNIWAGLGLEVVELPLKALFRRGGGAAVCLTNRLDGLDLEIVPEHLRFASLQETLEYYLELYPDSPPLA